MIQYIYPKICCILRAMNLHLRIPQSLRIRSVSPVVSCVRCYAETSTRRISYENENTNQNNSESNSRRRYAAFVTVAASMLGLYYYTSHKKVCALTKNPVECGEYRADLKTYSMQEVSKHDNKENGIWITFRRGVYNITDFVDKHPGGPSKIIMAAGGSIEPFWTIFANHNRKEIYELLETMRIGNISENDVISDVSNEHDPYAREPVRHKALKVNGQKPFCAEPPPSLLIESFVTPVELFYVRNHLPVPELDSESYALELATEESTRKTLKLEDIKKYPKHTITSVVMCGGNRRSEMAAEKPLKGLTWGVGAVGNAVWTGTKLCDILRDLGINEDDYDHVQFEGYDLDPSGTPYGASIPIGRAMDPKADVILAYEMNGQSIPRDHGFPIRVIVPGVVGARNVKWLAKIIVSKKESPSQWQQGDYKVFSPSTDWDNVDFSKAPAIQEMPVISAICKPEPLENVKVVNGKINVKGYAWSGGGRKIVRVDVTNDQGETWHTANLDAEDTNAKDGRHWSWTLWSIDLPVQKGWKETEIWAKAVDASYNVQPETVKNIWNLRGFLCNAYHKIKVKLDR
ncbi:sulfite oxidase [Ceratina calcarata]|uniref:Sulfite oxidase n=1 Tax=Ceratina calcarata TaxID=156304 RepID=A0AAJ7SB74_9HYME|nr:sulfite oxidase [Ceratina calcarata]XP_017889775.1 sulfite oxidase [Ceratina calcarata]XP_026673954.1 sulfite oxidase [Ceratina calcarata]